MILNKSKHKQNPDFRLAMEFRSKAKRAQTAQQGKSCWKIAFDFMQRYRKSLIKEEEK